MPDQPPQPGYYWVRAKEGTVAAENITHHWQIATITPDGWLRTFSEHICLTWFEYSDIEIGERIERGGFLKQLEELRECACGSCTAERIAARIRERSNAAPTGSPDEPPEGKLKE